MWPFRRRPKGRHALGAAVTAIPSASVQVPVPVQAADPAPPPVESPVAPPAEQPVAPPVAPSGPRVELGFRDGSTAALAPWSEQAKALTDIASALTQRD